MYLVLFFLNNSTNPVPKTLNNKRWKLLRICRFRRNPFWYFLCVINERSCRAIGYQMLFVFISVTYRTPCHAIRHQMLLVHQSYLWDVMSHHWSPADLSWVLQIRFFILRYFLSYTISCFYQSFPWLEQFCILRLSIQFQACLFFFLMRRFCTHKNMSQAKIS